MAGGRGGQRLVGRATPLRELEAALRDAVAGRGALALVTGEAGIGKSRLAAELAARAPALGARVVWASCWDGGGSPAYWPWVQALRAASAGRDPVELAADLGRGAGEVLRLAPELAGLLPASTRADSPDRPLPARGVVCFNRGHDGAPARPLAALTAHRILTTSQHQEDPHMRYEEVRELLLQHLTYSGVDGDKAHEIYHDDAILEFPQSGERFLGKANMQGFREQYPAQVDFEPRQIRGSGDFWIGEGRVLYDGANPVHFVWILEFRGDLVQRETIYFADPFPAPDWRRPWAEEGATWETQGDLPAHIRGGS